jgi:hydroxyacylglutathione hydrolase
MIIERIWTANDWRNYNYLVVCRETGDALAVDPLEHEKCLDKARANGWTISQVVNTHEHYDHTAGNDAVIAATGAKLLAHTNARPNLPRMNRALAAGDVIRVGRSVELECLDTPGHTLAHVCLLAHGDQRALISGDTLFNAGAGNCHNGGDPERLFITFEQQLARLDDDTVLYPGHDYLQKNLGFTLSIEPENERARAMSDSLAMHDPVSMPPTTLGVEKEINAFFRLQSRQIAERLRERCSWLSPQPDRREVFLALRELRDKW